MNRFRIITPSFNNKKWTDVNIDSVLDQTYDNYTVLYVDDCSTDGTYDAVMKKVGNNSKYTVIRNEKNMGAIYNYNDYFDILNLDDEDILVHLDGDDWLTGNDVLADLNKFYNENDFWMTYGHLVCYDGNHKNEDGSKGRVVDGAGPQNLPYHDYVHKYKLYRNDLWRASHLRTWKWFLYKCIDRNDIVSKITNEDFWTASDLAFQFAALEMCPPEKIGVVPFPTYVFNTTWAERAIEREAADPNQQFEAEIRTKKKYCRAKDRKDLTLNGGKKLPQVNKFGGTEGGSAERHTIPLKFSYVYNKIDGEFDLTVFQDGDCLPFLDGSIEIKNNSKIVAVIFEPPFLFTQKTVIKKVKENYKKFDCILAWNEELLDLPNAVKCNLTDISQWNTLPQKELDESEFQVYSKSKLCSIISSNKNLCEGHKFRLECVEFLKKDHQWISLFGRGFNPIYSKLEGMRDYMFHITIENGVYKNWFTEKIIDPFLAGCIPIYNGAPNIGEYFDTKGIITFNTQDELNNIVKSLTKEMYDDMLPYVQKNYDTAMDLYMTNDRFFDKYYKEIIS